MAYWSKRKDWLVTQLGNVNKDIPILAFDKTDENQQKRVCLLFRFLVANPKALQQNVREAKWRLSETESLCKCLFVQKSLVFLHDFSFSQ
jgi:hypothetical protein